MPSMSRRRGAGFSLRGASPFASTPGSTHLLILLMLVTTTWRAVNMQVAAKPRIRRLPAMWSPVRLGLLTEEQRVRTSKYGAVPYFSPIDSYFSVPRDAVRTADTMLGSCPPSSPARGPRSSPGTSASTPSRSAAHSTPSGECPTGPTEPCSMPRNYSTASPGRSSSSWARAAGAGRTSPRPWMSTTSDSRRS